jgi:hypothetical protein
MKQDENNQCNASVNYANYYSQMNDGDYHFAGDKTKAKLWKQMARR